MKTIIKPRHLMPGDTIGVYSPSSGIENDLKDNYLRGKNVLLERGYKVLESPHTHSWESHYSADGKTKAEDMMFLLREENVRAILPTLGGTTAYQILPYISFEDIARYPKMIFGFSDNSQTACVITAQTGLVTFHGHSDVVFGLGDLADKAKMETFSQKGHYTRSMFFDALEGRIGPGPVRKATSWDLLRKANSEGTLLGGNLQVLNILNGTKYSPSFENVIFYFEVTADVQLHYLDMLLATYSLSGMLSKLKGLIVGKGEHLKEEFYSAKHESFEEIIYRHTRDYSYPVIVNADIGHDLECCMLPNGIRASIEGDTLYLLESPYSG